MPAKRDKKTGMFKRSHQEWSPERWNDGFFTNRGRFFVYYPKAKKTYYEGYVLRSHLIWEMFSGIPIPKGFVIHHIDGDRTNDKFENLELISKKRHDRIHQKTRTVNIKKICIQCKKSFLIRAWRLKEKGANRGKFCSQKCFHDAGGRWYKYENSFDRHQRISRQIYRERTSKKKA